jgi:ATP-binding cassette subfamily B protein
LSASHPTPFQRLLDLLREDRTDLTVLLVYVLLGGVLSLATPLSAQALVNTIAAGFFVQPLIVLVFLALVGLTLAGFMRLLQIYLVERLQQRIFGRVAMHLAGHIPRMAPLALQGHYAPELVNRFFDVLTVQKSMAKLLLDGPAAMLQVSIGLVLMAFYSPWLLAFGVLILVSMAVIVGGLGRGGLRSSIRESIEKYRMAHWLQELARCLLGLKLGQVPVYVLQRADSLVLDYLLARRKHFRILYRMWIGNVTFQVIASVGILGLGGWLVIHRQLTLGQLVASELIVLSVLSALDKLIRQMEDAFDLLTGLDKVGHIFDTPQEPEGPSSPVSPLPVAPDATQGLRLELRDLWFYYPQQDDQHDVGQHTSNSHGSPARAILAEINLKIDPGEHLCVVGHSGSGKSTLGKILAGLYPETRGLLLAQGMDIREAARQWLRRHVAYVSEFPDIFDGSLEENLTLGLEALRPETLEWALNLTGLMEDLPHMPTGLHTRIVSGGDNLSRGQLQRLLLTRAVLRRPSCLVLDEVFHTMTEMRQQQIMQRFAQEPWTLVTITHLPAVVARATRVVVIDQGRLIESGSPLALAKKAQSQFAHLFPLLSQQLRAGEK